MCGTLPYCRRACRNFVHWLASFQRFELRRRACDLLLTIWRQEGAKKVRSGDSYKKEDNLVNQGLEQVYEVMRADLDQDFTGET
jgi:hypothetical protein